MVVALLVAPGGASEMPRPDIPERLSNPPGMVDRVHVFESAADWAAGRARRAGADVSGRLALLDVRPRAFPREGRWVSAETATDFPFTELVPSWNLDLAPESGATFQFRVRDAESGDWSPWLYLGQWGRTHHSPARRLWFEHGAVNIDYLLLDRPADAFQGRADFSDFATGDDEAPALRRLSVAYSGLIADAAERARLDPPAPIDGDWARSLDVPFRAQRLTGWAIAGETCSPTSVSMVMAYYDAPLLPQESALCIYDPEYALFGNWGRAVAFAGDHGLDARLQRFRDWDDVKREIARGVPVIASIRFERDTFPSNVLRGTNGHLIVVRGFTAEGDPIVNDPASYARGNAIVYKADELAAAWFDRGGVGYVIAAEKE